MLAVLNELIGLCKRTSGQPTPMESEARWFAILDAVEQPQSALQRVRPFGCARAPRPRMACLTRLMVAGARVPAAHADGAILGRDRAAGDRGAAHGASRGCQLRD